MAHRLGMHPRSVRERRRIIEAKYKISLETRDTSAPQQEFARRRVFEINDGTVIFFTDPHWLPDHSPTMQEALLTLCRELKPALVICGGDALDGTQISKWEPTRGHHQPYSLREQLDCVVDQFDAVRDASGKAQFAWTLGNHDARLSRYVATKAEQLLDLPYTRLEDWVPAWPLSWTIEINGGTPGMTVIRHRNMPGQLHMQAQKAGCHYVHGHLHRLNAHRVANYTGIWYSVDGGSMADPKSDAFDYAEGAPDHQQGFTVLTYRNGRLMPPEFAENIRGVPWFRGAPL